MNRDWRDRLGRSTHFRGRDCGNDRRRIRFLMLGYDVIEFIERRHMAQRHFRVGNFQAFQLTRCCGNDYKGLMGVPEFAVPGLKPFKETGGAFDFRAQAQGNYPALRDQDLPEPVVEQGENRLVPDFRIFKGDNFTTHFFPVRNS
jgi:hypothetical protein